MLHLKTRYGDWALVTGGTSGIGAALADQLASEGMNVLLVARHATRLDTQAADLSQRHKVQTRTVAADLSTEEGLSAVLAAAQGLDIGLLVPSAAMETQGVLPHADAAQQRALVQMNVIAPMELARVLGQGMVQRGRGAILFVSSLSGWMPQPWMSGYGASKSYILGLAAGMHFELKDRGVDVSVLSPGPTQTPMAQATGIDFAAMGMTVMSSQEVAACGLRALGQRLDAIPGGMNKFMVFMMTRLLSRSNAGRMLRMMMRKALPTGALR